MLVQLKSLVQLIVFSFMFLNLYNFCHSIAMVVVVKSMCNPVLLSERKTSIRWTTVTYYNKPLHPATYSFATNATPHLSDPSGLMVYAANSSFQTILKRSKMPTPQSLLSKTTFLQPSGCDPHVRQLLHSMNPTMSPQR